MINFTHKTRHRRPLALVLAATIVASVAGSASAALVITDIGTTAPTENVFEFYNPTSETWTLHTLTTVKGQTFMAPMIGASLDGQTHELIALALKVQEFGGSRTTVPSESAVARLKIYNWGANLNANQAGSSLYEMTASFPVVGLEAGDFIKFDLGAVLNLVEGQNYAFVVSFDSSETEDIAITTVVQQGGAEYAGSSLQGENSVKTNQDFEFYLISKAVPAPAALPAGLAMLGLAAMRCRRR